MGQNRKKRFLITGGAGFIGSHLCDRFTAEGHEVVALDNLITGDVKNLAKSRVRRFHFIKADLSAREPVLKGPVDFVLHFASPASPPDYLRHPIETLLVGSRGTHHALEIARKKRAVFVMASTSEVYGDPLVSPQKESYWGHVNPVGVRSVYDEAKRFSEAVTMSYRREHRLDARIIRIFNTYGPRMRPQDGRVIPNFITQALLGKPLTVYGDGSQTRSYCYADDLVEGIARFTFSKSKGPMNLGNPGELSVSGLARLILKLTGSKSRIVHKPLPADDPKQRCPDISLAKRELGWTPQVMLEEGLRRTIAYFCDEVL